MNFDRSYWLVAWLAVSWGAACAGDASGTAPCARGEEACDCYPNGTCNDGLACLSGKCVSANGPGVGGSGTGPSEDGGLGSGAESAEQGGRAAGGSSSSSSGSPATGGQAGPEPDEAYALGTISVGETHSSGSVNASSWVSATFAPHVQGAAASCTTAIGACRLTTLPDCGSCGADQYCGFSETCQATCLDLCGLSCPSGETCYFTQAGMPACGPLENFDAGELRLTGTREAVTLTPPYVVATQTGSPLFESGATLSLQALGAQGAGFAAFEQSFTATTLLSTGLHEISRQSVFGQDDLSVTWTPADGRISLSFTLVVAGGSAVLTCDADDRAGSFSLARSSLLEASGGNALQALSVAVSRTRNDFYEGFATQGMLSRSVVEPAGWLALATTSTETYTYQPCAANTVECDGACINLATDASHCGECDNVCPAAADRCVDGRCTCSPGTLCGAECVDVFWDPRYCGGCDNACGPRAICDEGSCMDCPTGLDPCEIGCVDLSADQENCGTCGNLCEMSCDGGDLCSGTCVAGQCVYDEEPDPVECEAGETECDSGCADTSSDPANCGQCELNCGGEACVGGVCDEPFWLCDPEFRDDGDCDCGCGSVDPDCSSGSADACLYCHCEDDDGEGSCDFVDPESNADCL